MKILGNLRTIRRYDDQLGVFFKTIVIIRIGDEVLSILVFNSQAIEYRGIL